VKGEGKGKGRREEVLAISQNKITGDWAAGIQGSVDDLFEFFFSKLQTKRKKKGKKEERRNSDD